MNKRQIRFLAILICGLAVMSLTATETRVSSMGGIGFYIRDNSNIFYFPGTVLQYQNQAVAELRAKNNDNLYTVGVHLAPSQGSTYGVYLNRPLSLPQDILEAVVSAKEKLYPKTADSQAVMITELCFPSRRIRMKKTAVKKP